MLSKSKFWAALIPTIFFMVTTLVVMPLVGPTSASLSDAFAGKSPDREIFFYARVPRVVLAAMGGGALAMAGVIFQALLRDALATPFTLGVQSGAALGAVVAICSGWRSWGPFPAVWLASFVGAIITIYLVISVAGAGRRMSSFTLLLTGVTINSICMAAILFLHYTAGFTQSFEIVRWLMGGIDSLGYSTLGILALGIFGGLGLAMAKSSELNVLSVGEEWAATRGVDTSRLMLIAYLLGSFVTASVTAFTGPIGFVGLIVPHGMRLLFGNDHRILIPTAFCTGCGFLVLSDTLARTVMSPVEIPVGVITAILGGPFFIWLLRSRRGSLWI